MNPETMITCVMVDDPAKTTPAKLTNYHVNRIQVNCYSSEANDSPVSRTNSRANSRADSQTNSQVDSQTNSLTNTLTNGSTLCGSSDSNTIDSSNRSTSPTHSSASSSSSRLFFVDKKLNQKLNQQTNSIANQATNQTEHPPSKPNHPGSQLENQLTSQLANQLGSQLKSVQEGDNGSPIKRTVSASSGKGGSLLGGSSQKKSTLQDAKLATSKATKSIYSEQSLKKQIHQFKERQANQLRYYSSSTSSSASSTASSKQYLASKRLLIDKHLSDKNLSESEPLSSLNYSLNYSNCSTTDTLLTKSTLRSTGKKCF